MEFLTSLQSGKIFPEWALLDLELETSKDQAAARLKQLLSEEGTSTPNCELVQGLLEVYQELLLEQELR